MLHQDLCLLRLEIGRDHRDDLRMFGFDHLGQIERILPFDLFEPGPVDALFQSGQEALGLLAAQGLFKNAANVGFTAADAERVVLPHQVEKLAQYRRRGLFGNRRHPAHRHGQPIYLRLRQEFDDLCGGFLADQHHHHGGLFGVGNVSRPA